MESILIDSIQKSLHHFMHSNAIFISQRLCAQFPSETNLQLLAACYLQSNQAYSAYHILKGTKMPQSRYLFAISCFQLDLLSEAEAALCPANESGVEVPNGAPGHYLLGQVYRYTDRRKSAINHFKQALSMDPLMWSAYEELCILGAAEEATVVFGEAASFCIQKQYINCAMSPNLSDENCKVSAIGQSVSEDVSPRKLRHAQGLKDIAVNPHGSSIIGGIAAQLTSSSSSNMSLYNTPSPMETPLSAVGPPPLCRNVMPNGLNLSTLNSDNSKSTVNPTIQQAPRRKFVGEGKLRKISGRLFSDSGPRRSSRLSSEASVSSNANATVVSGNVTSNSYKGGSKHAPMAFRTMTIRKGQSWANENIDGGIHSDVLDVGRLNIASTTSCSSASIEAKSYEQDATTLQVSGQVTSDSKFITGAMEILTLLRVLGEGYRLACLYKCQEALDTYLKLPQRHYNTGWVLSQVGKAHYELVDNLEADRVFSLARQIAPYSLEGMDIYSTVLYHLKEDMKLSYLAQELISTDRLAPQSWCAMGNCYSLQKDHETALKNFQRAVQLNPRFAYAHTLCGHEYVAQEDYENGIKSYQSALMVDSRHYNAWYGLGMLYLRQEKFEFSEHHFRMAYRINPYSSVILSYLGTALHSLKRSEEGLAVMEKAILADKKNLLPMYQKANILMGLERFDEALEVLEELKEYAPYESSVFALMGNIYRRRNKNERAMFHYGIALDLKPSATDAATIKAAIEKLHLPDELEDNL